MKMAARQDRPAALVQVEQVLEATRRRVLKVLYERGEVDRNTLYMLLAVKSDACWRIIGIVERKTDFVLTVSLPGTGPELSDPAESRELIVTSKPATYPLPAALTGWLDLPIDLQSDRVKASLHRGTLVVIAPKAAYRQIA
jgi:hypothetical protein